MKKAAYIVTILVLALFAQQFCAYALEEIKYDFEDGDEGWNIPDWAYYQKDHKAVSTEASSDVASSGKNSLKVMCDYPGNVWTAALVEAAGKDYDFFGYDSISVDVYLPKNAPKELMVGRIILTVGEGWLFTEMRFPEPLKAGKWTTITAKLDNYENPDSAWKGKDEKRLFLNIHKIKKIAVRIEYDASPPTRLGPRYNGPIYIDNLRVVPGDPAAMLRPPAPSAVPQPAGKPSGEGQQQKIGDRR